MNKGTLIGSMLVAAMILVSTTTMAEPPTGNLLSDTDFPSSTILAPFGSSVPDQWKDEAAQIAIGTVEGITPQSPDGMLQLNETGLNVSQVRQSINVSDYANEIDSGMVSAVARAFYNCPTGACIATLSIRNTATRLQPLQEGITAISPLNGDSDLWQEANVGLSKPVAIPLGTRSIDIEVAFVNGTIPNGGFVDDAFLELRFSQCEAQGGVIPGETVQVTYKGLEPDQEILAFLGEEQVLDEVFAETNGEGTIQLPIPANTPEGTHLITIEHDGSDLSASCTVKSLPSPPPPKTCDPDTPGVNPIMGTEGKDFLRGTPGDDVIIGLGGNDTILGFGGNDCIEGGEGNDLIFGRGGDDQLIGGPGNDRIFSSGGADMVTGGAGDDQIFGGAGNDEIDGNDGEDKISGGPGMDACANGILSSCEKDIDPPIMMSQSIVSGRIFAADGSAVPDVLISAFKNGEPFSFPDDETPITANMDGSFEIFLATEEEVTLKFDADGFATQVLPVIAPALENGRVDIDVMMIAQGEAQTVNASTGGTVTGTDGANITITGGSFVDQAGNPLNDNDKIVVTITPVDISTTAGLETFPGEFSGVAEGKTTESPIETYGVVEFDLTLEGTGEKVKLAEGQTADIDIPLFITQNLPGNDFAVGDSFPVWYLDELTGIWIQEESGVVISSADSPTGLVVQATVAHFTWWNNDLETTNPAMATVTVVDTQGMIGSAVVYARSINRLDGGYFDVNETSPPLIVASNVETCFWAEIIFDDGTKGTTKEQCFTPEPNENFSVPLELPPIPIWQDDIAVSTNMMNWSDAISYCEDLVLDGHGPGVWKLPTEAYLLDMINAVPFWDNKFFGGPTDGTTGVYWLASESPDNSDNAHGFVHSSSQPGEIQTFDKIFYAWGVRCVIGEPTQ